MFIYNVLATAKIAKNTAVLIDGKGNDFPIGTGVLDDKGLPHEILSVGLDGSFSTNVDDTLHKTSLLLSGKVNSKKIYV